MTSARPLALLVVLAVAGDARAEDASGASASEEAAETIADTTRIERREAGVVLDRGAARAAVKGCCGYPLVEEQGFALRFYWLAREERFEHLPADTDLYTPEGYPLGTFPERFARALRMEGSGLLSDGRVVNYAGRCKYGYGTCFRQLDADRFPYGKGASRRTLMPFRSVAIDKRYIRLGDALYIPEFDGLRMPDGSVHDGCVRADDTGGNIKKRKMDFFVVRYENFRKLLNQLHGVIWITPHVASEHCQYLSIR